MLVAFVSQMEEGRPYERRVEAARESILLREKQSIAERVRCVCQWMTEPEFDALVTRMAEISIRFRLRRISDYFERPDPL